MKIHFVRNDSIKNFLNFNVFGKTYGGFCCDCFELNRMNAVRVDKIRPTEIMYTNDALTHANRNTSLQNIHNESTDTVAIMDFCLPFSGCDTK